MTVQVDRPPRAPQLTGDPKRDVELLWQFTRDAARVMEQLRERTGGTTDAVAANAETANTANATAAASQAGATIPTEGGSITLTPSNPLSYTLVSEATARINVVQHTRTGAAAPLLATTPASAPVVARGYTYYVYYSDAGDLGGAQTYLADILLATVTGTAGYRIIGTIDIPAQNYSDRHTDV